MQSETYDIVVIGGGPSGSAAALRAARRGARVLLAEKTPMPRPKLCGGWVSNRALGLLDCALPDSAVATPFTSIELRTGAAGITYTPQQTLGVFVDRAVFDATLVDAARGAGAEVRFDRVHELTASDAGTYTIRVGARTVRAGGVVLCTGAGGSLIRSLRGPDGLDSTGMCLEERIAPAHGPRLGVAPGTAQLLFDRVPHGFGWVIHHGDSILIGIGARRSKLRSIKAAYASFRTSLGLNGSASRPQGHPIPLGGFTRRLGTGRLLAAGDAAGCVDAFNGEGIAFAIASGQLAAEALVAVDGPAAGVYETRFRRQLYPELRWSLVTHRMYYRLPAFLLRRLWSDRGALERYTEVLEGSRTYKSYLGWLTRRVLVPGSRE